MPQIPRSLKASLLAIAIAGGGYHEMTRETLIHVEGIEYTPYRDIAGILTVCVGHTGADIQMRTYTHDECMALLDSDLKPVRAAIKRLVKVPLPTTNSCLVSAVVVRWALVSGRWRWP